MAFGLPLPSFFIAAEDCNGAALPAVPPSPTLQNWQPLHWHRAQCAALFFTEQNVAQPSTFISPGKVEVQAFAGAGGGGGGGGGGGVGGVHIAHLRHWHLVQCAALFFSLQNDAQPAILLSPARPEEHTSPADDVGRSSTSIATSRRRGAATTILSPRAGAVSARRPCRREQILINESFR